MHVRRECGGRVGRERERVKERKKEKVEEETTEDKQTILRTCQRVEQERGERWVKRRGKQVTRRMQTKTD